MGIWGVLLGGFLLAPLTVLGQTTSTADAKAQPKVNFFNNNRYYQRPVKNFFRKINFQVSSKFASRYVWNNIAYSEGAVWQPSASLEFHGFGFAVLGNFVLDNEPNQGQFNEVDFTLYYGRTVKKLEIDFSVTFSVYPNDNPASLNFSNNSMGSNIHLSYPLGPIDLFTDISLWAFAPKGGVFWDIGIGYHKSLPLNFTLSTSFLIGLSNSRYNGEFIGPGLGTGPNLIAYSLAFPVSPVKGFIITPQFNVSTFLSTGLKKAVRYPTNIYGQLTLGYHF